MNDELLISIAFPEDTYKKILQDLENFSIQEMDQTSTWIRQTVEFFLFYHHQLLNLDNESYSIGKEFIFHDINLVKPNILVELLFDEMHIDAILDFLDKYDNAYFWKAFGISLEKGNVFYEQMISYDKNPSVFSEIHTEIINSGKLNKDIIVNELFSHIYFKFEYKEDFIETMSYFLFMLREVFSKYPSVNEALNIIDNKGRYETVPFALYQNLIRSQDKLDIPPKVLFEFIKWADLSVGIARFSHAIHTHLLNSGNDVKNILLSSFRIHRYGYEAYKLYLCGCKAWNWEPALKINNNPEVYFYNSYKVPQIKSLCNRYFSTLPEVDAKKKTQKCFEFIYEELMAAGFLDKDCRVEEFLWAFSLIDDYPFAFKKIKFYTLSGRSKKEKGNGAFLCLLNILGYKKDEIAQLLHRNPELSEINKTFDLSMQDKTSPSRDYDKLLKIVASSGLPVK